MAQHKDILNILIWGVKKLEIVQQMFLNFMHFYGSNTPGEVNWTSSVNNKEILQIGKEKREVLRRVKT
jgi:hypothetical protein